MKAGVLESHHLALPSEEPCWQQFVDSPGSRVGGWGVGGGGERERGRGREGKGEREKERESVCVIEREREDTRFSKAP